MALINHAKREINAKLVYFGPAQSGKSTSLNVIYKKLNPECRGKLKSMAVQKDRMLFFDFTLPGQGDVGGYRVRFHVYTLAGKVTGGAAWKMVLKGTDGVVFVVDSAPDKVTVNRESLATLREQLQGCGRPLHQMPCVVQCNKRDVAGALSLDELRQTCAVGDAPLIPAIARKGEGILDALSRLVQMVTKDLQDSGLELQSSAAGGMDEAASPAVSQEPVGLPLADAEVCKPKLKRATALAAETVPSAVTGQGSADEGPVTEPAIECAGKPELLADGRVRLPLVVRCGGGEKKFSLAVSISLEHD
jgi:signal recognition particle receptor subunit beta